MALDLQSLSITSVFNSIVNFFRSQENNSKWRDFSTGSEGSFLIRMLANVFSAISYRIVAQSRENYLSTAALTASNIGIAVNLGYSVFRGSNLRRRISFRPNGTYTFPKLSVIGTYNDSYDIITAEEVKLVEGENTEFDVIVGKIKEASLITGTSAVKFFPMFTTGISEDYVLYLDSQEVPTTSEIKEMIYDKYLVRTNPYSSVDIAYLNNLTDARYTYGVGSEITIRYVELAKFDEVPFTETMFPYGSLLDSKTLSSYLPFESVEDIKVKAPLDHETQNLIRSKEDYASRLRIEVPDLISTNWDAITPTLTQISYLKSDNSLLSDSEKDGFIEAMKNERYFGTPLPDVVPPRREVADLEISLELANKYKNVSDVDLDVTNVIKNFYDKRLSPSFNIYDLERRIENLSYVRYARVNHKINSREANRSYQLGYILYKEETGNYYMATKILGISGQSEPDWNIPFVTPKEVDTGIEQTDGSIIWRIYKRLPNVSNVRVWTKNSNYGIGEWVYPTNTTKYMMKCVDLVKQSGGSAPAITYAEKGDFIIDGGIVWVVQDYAEGTDIPTWSETTNYRLGDRVNIVSAYGNFTLQCVSYTGTVSSQQNIPFEQDDYAITGKTTTTFIVDGNQKTFFMPGDNIRAIAADVTNYFIVSSAVYDGPTNKTTITVTTEIDSGKDYTTLETEVGGTRDGQILWTLVDNIDDIKYEWNAYVTFDHELNIIGG